MKIAEIYRSIQGEGLLTGAASVFVRTSGCNLRCWFCDSPFTSWAPEGGDLSVEEIMGQVAEWDLEHVVLTGGEPMLWSELIPLATALADQKRHITIETAGTLYLPVACDLMSISPKLANSTPDHQRAGRWRHRHEAARHAPEVIERLIDEYVYQFKFVVSEPEDCAVVERYLDLFPRLDRSRVLLMPEGVDVAALEARRSWLEPYCAGAGLGYCARRHIEWFGLVRGT